MLLDLLSGQQRMPAGCVIKVGAGKREITDLYPFLTEVRVETSRTEAWTATLTFETRRDEHGRWAVQDAGILALWEPVEIHADFGGTTEEILRGYIREIRASYPEDPGSATVTVECQDDSFALDRQHVRQAWGEADAPMTDGQIFQEIASRHNLSPDPPPGEGLSGLVLLQDTTDISFLRERAEINGYELYFHEGKVYFGPMRLQGEPQPTIKVYAGPDTQCRSFTVRADAHQPERVAYDRAAPEGTEVEEETVEPDLHLLGPEPATGGGSGLQDFVWRMRRQGGATDAETLRARAQARANELSMRIKAQGEMDGSLYGHVLRVGETVPVDGVGERLGGLYYVDKVSHRFSVDGYFQSFDLLRNAYGDNVSETAPGVLGALGLSLSASVSIGF